MSTVTPAAETSARLNETANRGPASRKESLTRKGWNAFDVWQERVRRAAEGARSAHLEGRGEEPSAF
jgi:hypothetical protein